MGTGTIVMHDALINTGAKIGYNCILNTKSLDKVIKGADIVFHFAALADLDRALKDPINSVKIS